MIERPKTAISLDLDGVVFKRIPFQAEAFWNYLNQGNKIYWPFIIYLPIDRTPVDSPITSINERIRYKDAQKRKLKNGVKEFIQNKSAQADLFINTGRSTRKLWIDMTMDRLKEEGVDQYFNEEAFFKPKGVKSKEGKAIALKELIDKGYTDITHYDDNPEDVLPLARMFPQVKFVIVQDLSTGILFSRKEAKRYKNVRRIASFAGEITN